MTQAQLRRLHAIIARHTRAQINLSWKGSTHPDEWPDIEAEAKKAKKELRTALASLRGVL